MNNPYEAPQALEVSHSLDVTDDDPVLFEGEIDSSEIKSLFSSWFVFVWLGFMGFFGWYNDIGHYFRLFWKDDLLGLVAVGIVLVAFCRVVYLTIRYRIGNGYLHYFQRNYPDLFLPIRGELNADFLILQNEHMVSNQLRSSIVNAFVCGTSIWILFDSMGMNSRFLSRSLFKSMDFERFVVAITSDVKRNKFGHVSVWNNPALSNREQILTRSFDKTGIPFSGVITKGDCLTTEVKSRLQKSVLKIWFYACYSLLVCAAWYYLLSNFLLLQGVAVVLSVFMFGRQLRKLQRFGVGVPNHQPIMAVSGRVCVDHLQLATPLSTVDFQWSAFDAVNIDEDTLGLRFNGQAGQYFFLLRSHFRSDQDWEECCQFLKQQIPDCHPA